MTKQPQNTEAREDFFRGGDTKKLHGGVSDACLHSGDLQTSGRNMKQLICSLVVGISSFSVTNLQADPATPAATASAATEVKHTTGKEAKALLEANAAAAAKGKEKKIVILDVRTPDEFEEGHIADAKNVNFRSGNFEKEVAQLDKSQPYLVHCAGGGRSTSSLQIFQKLGFKTIIHLDGGLSSWTQEGNPVVK